MSRPSARQPAPGQESGPPRDLAVVIELQQEPGLLLELAQRLEERKPVDRPVAGRPVTVQGAVGVLQVEVGEQRTRLAHLLVGRGRAKHLHDRRVARVEAELHVG